MKADVLGCGTMGSSLLRSHPPRTGVADAPELLRVVDAPEDSAQRGRPVRFAELSSLGDIVKT